MSERHHAETPADGAARFTGPKRRMLVTTVALLVVGIAAGTVFGYYLAGSEIRQFRDEAAQARDDLDLLARAHETLQERNWILYLDLEAARAPEESEPVEPTPGTFGDGTYAVGTDIEPGTYRGEVAGEFGYWARLNNTSGMVSGIEANAIVRGPFILTIVSSDVAVELRGVTLTAEE